MYVLSDGLINTITSVQQQQTSTVLYFTFSAVLLKPLNESPFNSQLLARKKVIGCFFCANWVRSQQSQTAPLPSLYYIFSFVYSNFCFIDTYVQYLCSMTSMNRPSERVTCHFFQREHIAWLYYGLRKKRVSASCTRVTVLMRFNLISLWNYLSLYCTVTLYLYLWRVRYCKHRSSTRM